ncbi:protein timeless homolog [Convolutriloba macropyga]|uniref:protein timeless homolog n=1 Tax=Convolutriloba macropyga TaxID=536237 RepID=UPI003F52894E
MDFAEARLHACCASLGFYDEATGVYTKEPDCELSCKELIRTLKREDDTRQVRRKVGFLKVFENDLISIICTYPDDTELFDSVVRLMQNLSSPPILCFGNMPTDPQFRSYYMELERYLRSYKQAFVNETLIYNIGVRIKYILESDDAEDEESQLLIERILILLRNILHIDSNPTDENRTDDDASVHDQVIWAMKKTGVEAILKYLAINEDQSKWCMHVLEILFHMLRDQSPELLASTPAVQISDIQEWQKSQKEAEIEAKELCTLLLKEKEQRKCRAAVSSTRHSRFGGSYYVKNLKALNPNNTLIYHGTQSKANYISFDDMKPGKRKPKRLQPIDDRAVPRRSTKVIRQFLKEFVNELLEDAFNNLMHAASDAIRREKIQYNDESYFLWSMGFFLEFNRCYKFRPEFISEVLSSQIFSFIHLKMGEYYELMLQEKKTQYVAVSWAERMHFALKAFGELLKSCEKMGNHKEKDVQRSADILKRNLFYNSEYRDLFISFMQRFDQTKMSKSYLKDLVETNHVFLKMLEDFASKKKLIIKKKGGKKKKKPQQRNQTGGKSGAKSSGSQNKNKQESEEAKRQAELEKLELLWDNIAPSLCGVFQGRISPPEQTMMPFDPLSDVSLEDQKQMAVARLQRLLHSVQKVENSDDNQKPEIECNEVISAAKVVELLRECRKVWTEGEIFGAVDASVEEEFDILRSIHFADKIDISAFKSSLGQFKDFEHWAEIPDFFSEAVKNSEDKADNSEDDGAGDDVENNEALFEELVDGGLLSDSSSSDDEMRNLESNEQYFDFNSHLHQYARHDVVRCYSYLLQFFRTNFSQTNKSVLKMLHRIACDLSMPGLLFQASLFKILRDILREASIRTQKQKLNLDSTMNELVTFSKYLIKQFVKAAQTNKDIYMELVFWKDTSVAAEIIDGYGTYVKHGRSGEDFRIVFTEENNAELISLFKQYQESEQNEASGGVVEFIMANFSRELNKPKVVANQLKSLGLVTDMNELRMVSGRENLGVWRPEHETELKFLWEEFHESEDPLTEIYNAMVHKKPKVRIIQKLLALGLANNKNEIMKPDIWPESLIEELKNLFEEHNGQPDLLREILDRLSIPKSRKQIANKLVDLKLVENIAELRPQKSAGVAGGGPKKSGKAAKDWDEQEILELQELYGKYRKLKLILEHKTFEASRKEVIEKMKELNLDYKATGVTSKKKGKGLNFLEANDLLQEDDFDIEEQMAKDEANRKSTKKSKSRYKMESISQPLPNGELSSNAKSQLATFVRNIVKKNEGSYSASVNWLVTSLKSAADVKKELENDSDQDNNDESSQVSFPLVPNGEVVEMALIDCEKEFSKLLKLLGMSSPLTDGGGEGTEIFWRVPHYLTSDVIMKKVEALKQALDKSNLVVDDDNDDDNEFVTEDENENSRQFSNDRPNVLHNISKSKGTGRLVEDSDAESSAEDAQNQQSSDDEQQLASKRREQLEALQRKAAERKKKERIERSVSDKEDGGAESDSDVEKESRLEIDENDDNDVQRKRQKSNTTSKASNAPKRRKIDENAEADDKILDSNDDDDGTSIGHSHPVKKTSKQVRSRLQRVDLSDSENENESDDDRPLLSNRNEADKDISDGASALEQANSTTKQQTRRALDSESEDNDLDEDVNTKTPAKLMKDVTNTPTPENPKKRKRAVAISSSDEEN